MSLKELWWVYRQLFCVHLGVLVWWSAICLGLAVVLAAWRGQFEHLVAFAVGAWAFYVGAIALQTMREGQAYLNAAREWWRDEDLP